MSDNEEKKNVEDQEEEEDKKPGKMSKKEQKKFLDVARKRLKRGIDADSHNVEAGIRNLRFVYIKGEQWDQDARNDRKADNRLCLEINLLRQYLKQLVGDERQSRPWIKVRRKDKSGTPQAALVRQGYINDVLYRSRAASIFDYAIQMMGAGNRGAWRVLTRYTDENPFEQEVYLERFANPYVVIMDPDCVSEVKADAKWGFVIEKIQKEKYISDHGDKFVSAISSIDAVGAKGMAMEHWYDKETITIAEYFYIEEDDKTYCMFKDGSYLEKEEADEKVKNYTRANKEDASVPIPEIVKERTVKVPTVKWCKINGLEILEGPETIPGRFIPLIQADG